MAQITTLQPYGVPGRTRTFTAKTAADLTQISIIATSMPTLVHITDSPPNLVIAGDIEVQSNSYLGGNLNHYGNNAGFYGTAPIAQAVLATGAGRTVDDIIAALQNLGLVKQS